MEIVFLSVLSLFSLCLAIIGFTQDNKALTIISGLIFLGLGSLFMIENTTNTVCVSHDTDESTPVNVSNNCITIIQSTINTAYNNLFGILLFLTGLSFIVSTFNFD